MPETSHVIFDQTKEAPPPSPRPSPEPQPGPAATPLERETNGRFLPKGVTALLARQAREAGLEDADLKEMTAEEIRDHVQEHRWNKRLEQVWNVSERREQSRQPSPEGPATADPPGLTIKSSDEDPDQGFHPQIVAEFKKLHDRLNALEGKFGPVAQHVETQARREGESFARRMERFYAKHPETYGRGTLPELEKADAEFKQSPEFFARMQTFAAWKKAGADLEALEDTLESEHQKRFSRQAPPANDATDADDEVAEWEEGILARPTQHGHTEDAPGREKALQGLRNDPALKTLNGKPRKTPPQRGEYLKH